MRKFIKNRFKNEKGLTLVELLAVIVILAIVAGIAFVMIGNIIENSKKDAQIANAEQLLASAKLYEANGKEIDGTEVTAKELHDEGLIETIYDPWNKGESIEMSDSKVAKSDNEYTVTIKTKKNNNDHGISKTEEDLRKGRKEVFGEDEG